MSVSREFRNSQQLRICEILDKFDRYLDLPDLVFQQDSTSLFVCRKTMGRARLATVQSRIVPYGKFLCHTENKVARTISCLVKLEETVMDAWNMISPEVIQNMYSFLKNCLPKFIKNNGNMIV